MKKSALTVIVILMLMALYPNISLNAQYVDENNGWNSSFITTVGQVGSDYYAQSFYADVSTITSFGVVISEINPEGQLVLAIAPDDGTGMPDVASLLYQGALKNPTATGDWFYETGISVPVVVGQKYWIVIDGYNNPGATGSSGIGTSNNSTDTGEGMLFSNSAGSSWSSISSFKIAIYVEGIKPTTIDQNTPWNNNVVSSIGATGSDFYAQSFYAGVDFITGFGVVLKELDAEGQLVLSIAADNGSGYPNVSAPLYQGTLKNPATTGAWFYETGLHVPVTVGQKYWILIDGYDNAGATGRSAVGLSDSITNTGEGMMYSNSAGVGTWSFIPGWPLAIYVEGINAAIISENNGANNGYVSSIGADGSDFYGQSFYAKVEVLTDFGMNLMELAAGGEVRLAIAANNGSGYPNVSSPLFESGLLNPSTTGQWFYETGLNIPLTVGAKYWVVVDGYDNPGATGCSYVGLSSSFTNTGEGMIYSNSGGIGGWSSIPYYPLAVFIDGQLASLPVNDTVVSAGESACFDATGTITLGGSGPVLFAAGSSVDLIAGYSIQMKPGFHAASGSDVHAWITANSGYCMVPPGIAAPEAAYKSLVFNTTSTTPDEPLEDHSMKIFPNPSGGVFTIELKNMAFPAMLTITDALGEVVYQSNQLQGNTNRFDLTRFGKGLYIVKVNDGKSVITRKLIVQ